MDTTETPVEVDYLAEYFNRIKKREERFTDIVNFHANVFLATREPELIPYTVDSQYVNVSQYDYDEDDNTSTLNVDKTLELLAKVSRYAREAGYQVEKSYDTDDFNVKITIDPKKYLTVTYYTKRDTVCEAKVVGQKVVPGKPAEPPKVVDVIEWECSKLSLIELANNLED